MAASTERVFIDTDPSKEPEIAEASFHNSARLNALEEVRGGWISDMGSPVRKFSAPMDRSFLRIIDPHTESVRSKILGLFVRGTAAGAAAGATYTLCRLLY